jgi:hypothetical protein
MSTPPSQIVRGNIDISMNPTTGIATTTVGGATVTSDASTSVNGQIDPAVAGSGIRSASIGNSNVAGIAVSTSGSAVSERGYALSRAVIPVTAPGAATYRGSYIGTLTTDYNDGNASRVLNYVRGNSVLGVNFDTGLVSGSIQNRAVLSTNGSDTSIDPSTVFMSGSVNESLGTISGTTRGGALPGTATTTNGTMTALLGGPNSSDVIGGLTFEHNPNDGTPRRITETGVFRGN